MALGSEALAAISSTVLRLAAYAFLRWIPGHHFPVIVFTAAAVYLPSFVYNLQYTSAFNVISDEIDIITQETVGQGIDSDVDSDSGEGLQDEAETSTSCIIEETMLLEEKKPSILKSLLLGVPSPTSLFWSFITAAINFALIAMTIDMVYRAPLLHESQDLSFARAGYVSSDSAKLLVREPDMKNVPIYLSYRYADTPLAKGAPDATWKDAGFISFPKDLNQSTDYTGSITISDLLPDTRYQYAFSNKHTGYFSTSPIVGKASARNDGKFTFLHSSCIKARFPYNPLSHPLHIPGFRYLADWIPKLKAHFMIFLGDFIYIDVPHRFGKDAETYRSEYRRVYASPEWPSVSDSLPWIHVLDDHEIANDWDGNTTGLYQAASDPWENYHVSVNPPAVQPGHSYFEFTQGPASFFLMDTRRYRTPENANKMDFSKSMLGQQQLADLLTFLRRPLPPGVRWKIVVSSIPFTKNWRFGDADTWGGYLAERQVVLEAMWEAGANGAGVVVLSGDRHEFAATSFPPPKDSRYPATATVYEYSTSPLSMFYLPLRTYKQTDGEDICIKYIPDGNSKFGAVEISVPKENEQSMLHYRLFVDGNEVWDHLITAPVEDGAGLGGSWK
ncbi:alkaline phosphatase family protein [Trichodelitschia bisporula]|uniref:Alkaline phosphatase family protein n=1 Tax=Trichodelitschia bisporula TaxID=703511 RepID=A0A6G1I4M7_9PEZI|nr:alkaline phosphatase family protein [Trichodelitschia bisporula]